MFNKGVKSLKQTFILYAVHKNNCAYSSKFNVTFRNATTVYLFVFCFFLIMVKKEKGMDAKVHGVILINGIICLIEPFKYF